MSRRRLLARLSLATLAIVLTAGLGWAGAAAQEMRFFRIGTATTGGTYFPVGALIASAISNPPGSRPCERGGSCGVPGLIAVAQATAGSVDNLALLRGGGLEAALAQADVAHWAYQGTMIYGDSPPFRGLRAIASLYSEAVHLVVRAAGSIRTIQDLRGKRVSIGEEGSGILVDARLILDAHGLTESDFTPVYESPARSADLLAEGSVDAFLIIGGAPFAAIRELAEDIPIRLIGLDRGCATLPRPDGCFYTAVTIPAGTYRGIDEDVRTLGVAALLLVRADLDEAVAHGIARALWHKNNRPIFEDGGPAGEVIRPSSALYGVSVPLHPGAVRYYQETGLLATEPPAAPPETGTAPPQPPPPPEPPNRDVLLLPDLVPPG